VIEIELVMDQTKDEKKAENRLAWGRGRMAFIAQQDRIARMIAEGWPQTMIYKELEPHLNGLSYSQFSVHIRKNILKTQKVGASQPEPRAAATAVPVPDTPLKSSALESASIKKAGFKSFVPGPKDPDPKELW
jgi:hypothetical protein